MKITAWRANDINMSVHLASQVKKSPSGEHGLGPLRASFIVRQVEQPLSASIPPLHLALIYIYRDCENVSSLAACLARQFLRDSRNSGLRKPFRSSWCSKARNRKGKLDVISRYRIIDFGIFRKVYF